MASDYFHRLSVATSRWGKIIAFRAKHQQRSGAPFCGVLAELIPAGRAPAGIPERPCSRRPTTPRSTVYSGIQIRPSKSGLCAKPRSRWPNTLFDYESSSTDDSGDNEINKRDLMRSYRPARLRRLDDSYGSQSDGKSLPPLPGVEMELPPLPSNGEAERETPSPPRWSCGGTLDDTRSRSDIEAPTMPRILRPLGSGPRRRSDATPPAPQG